MSHPGKYSNLVLMSPNEWFAVPALDEQSPAGHVSRPVDGRVGGNDQRAGVEVHDAVALERAQRLGDGCPNDAPSTPAATG